MTPKPGEVYVRDGEWCEVADVTLRPGQVDVVVSFDVTFDCVWYRTESGEFAVPVYTFNEWAAGAKQVEKESDDDSES